MVRQRDRQIVDRKKQGPQGPQKLSFLKLLKIQKPTPKQGFSLLHPSEMAFLSHSWLQRPKERSTNKGDMDEKTKRLVSELVKTYL